MRSNRHLAGPQAVSQPAPRPEPDLADRCRRLEREVGLLRAALAGAPRVSAYALDLQEPGEAGILRETLDSLDASVVVYDAADRYVLGNRCYHALYPHLPADDQLAGKSFEEMLRLTLASGAFTEADAAADPEAFVARRLAERRLGNRSCERRHPSGRWDLVRTLCMPSGGRVTLRIDITAQKRLQEALEAAKGELESANGTKSRFLAALSHEFRTPLNAIIGFSDVMRAEMFGPLGSDRYAGYVADIGRSGEHMLSLINDLLDLSRIEAGRMPLADEEIALPSLLTEQVRLCGATAPDKMIECCGEGTLCLVGDRRMLRQMLLNLLSNGLKYAERRVTVATVARQSGGIDISVSDDGPGIPPDALNRIAEPFYQVPRSPGEERGGTGLGLAIVKEMMAMHGGALVVESPGARGTTVTLRFPASRSLRLRARPAVH